jgi:choline dehydrogenase
MLNGLHAFDYVIVGAGSAGCVLANRLSANPATKVCLIEAGRRDTSPLINIPLGLIWLAKDPKHNWLFKTTPQQGLNGRQVSVPRGKVLGGSSAINGMNYIRGHRADYDSWAAAGCTGWSYDDVRPFFEKLKPELPEAMIGDPNAVDHDLIDAAARLQIGRCNNFNADAPEGFGIYPVTQRGGKRNSSARAFLRDAEKRSNLTILTNAEVMRITFEGKRATGVVVRFDGKEQTVAARGEIVLSAGAIGSPDILLKSGIGPAAQIKSFGGDVHHDLPGVGQNLHDHVDMMMICQSASMTPYGISIRALPRLAWDGLRWVFASRGMLSSNMVEAGGFTRSQPSEPRPDLQFHIIPGRKSHRGRMVEYGHGISLHCCVLRPDSRGSITRKKPDGPPDIDLGLLRDDRDLERLLRGVKIGRRLLAQQPMAKHGLTEIVPGSNAQTDDQLRSAIRDHARTVYHPVGTCAMGVGPQSVVDPQLKVRGIGNLRIADASIMPSIVSGNTNVPAIMIGAKCADLLLSENRVKF